MAMKKTTTKKTVAKKTTVKPMMKRGGSAKPLRKAADGITVPPGTVAVNSAQGKLAAQRAQEQKNSVNALVGTINPNTGRPLATRQDASNYYNMLQDTKAQGTRMKKGGVAKMKTGSIKKSLPKAQTGTQTPFQEYMKIPGAVPSDTSSVFIKGFPKTGSSLDNAYSATYGDDYREKVENYGALEKFRGDSSKYTKPLKKGTTIKKKGGSITKPKMAKGGSTDKKWIQKAINPEHKGYCTPMTKPTCTPKRKALAKTLKKMAKNR